MLESRGEFNPGTQASLEKFALRFLDTESWALGRWFTGEVHIHEKTIYNLCKNFSYLDNSILNDSTNYVELTSNKDGNIIHVPNIDFFCGSGELNSQFKEFERSFDPTMNGTYWLLRAKGKSMENNIFAGDYLYGKELDAAEYLPKGCVCAIVTTKEAIIKRVVDKEYSRNEKFTKLILESDNKLKFPDLKIIKSNEICRVFKIEDIRKKI